MPREVVLSTTGVNGQTGPNTPSELNYGTGSPEGVYLGFASPIPSLYVDTSAPALYVKQSGNGTRTGWIALTGGSTTLTEIVDGDSSVSVDDSSGVDMVAPSGAAINADADGAATVNIAASGDVSVTADTSFIVGVDNNDVALSLNNGDVALTADGGVVGVSIDGSLDVMQFLAGASGTIELVAGSLVLDGTQMGFFGNFSVAQPAPIANAAGGVVIDAEARTALNALLAAVRLLGLIDT